MYEGMGKEKLTDKEEGQQMNIEEIKETGETLASFFLVFDATFLFDEKTEELLNNTKKALEKKILHNESCLPVILAMGGNYDSGVDRAKVEEINALLELIKARKKLQRATEKEFIKKTSAQVNEIFGL